MRRIHPRRRIRLIRHASLLSRRCKQRIVWIEHLLGQLLEPLARQATIVGTLLFLKAHAYLAIPQILTTLVLQLVVRVLEYVLASHIDMHGTRASIRRLLVQLLTKVIPLRVKVEHFRIAN